MCNLERATFNLLTFKLCVLTFNLCFFFFFFIFSFFSTSLPFLSFSFFFLTLLFLPSFPFSLFWSVGPFFRPVPSHPTLSSLVFLSHPFCFMRSCLSPVSLSLLACCCILDNGEAEPKDMEVMRMLRLLEEFAACWASETGLLCGSMDDGETESNGTKVLRIQ